MDAVMEKTNLEHLLFDRNISTKKLSEILGITERAANNKIKRRSQFTYREVLKIGETFPDKNIDEILEGYGV